jgi:hypothetical protein
MSNCRIIVYDELEIQESKNLPGNIHTHPKNMALSFGTTLPISSKTKAVYNVCKQRLTLLHNTGAVCMVKITAGRPTPSVSHTLCLSYLCF